ncbi:hypothetical protein Y032_0819g2525 [Ancylostoma ceylanicum]|nr:hypothetical protein Y032_0819g2525 [Ancylostoma ceylanicum]
MMLFKQKYSVSLKDGMVKEEGDLSVCNRKNKEGPLSVDFNTTAFVVERGNVGGGLKHVVFTQTFFQKGPDYGAIVIRTAAGVVIFISLSLILLIVGNMIYTTLTDRVQFRERVIRCDEH